MQPPGSIVEAKTTAKGFGGSAYPKVYPAHAAAKASTLQTLKPKMPKSTTCKPPNLELKTFEGVPGKVLSTAVQGDT